MYTIDRRPDPRGLRLRGAFVVLDTPTAHDGTADEAGFRRQVRRQLVADIDGIVIEAGGGACRPTLTPVHDRLITIAVEMRNARTWRRRTAIIATVGAPETADAIRATRRARDLGADAVLVAPPAGELPDQWALEAHFREIADAGGLPIVVDNVPGRTGANVDADTFLRLAEHPRIVGIREASGDLDQVARICRYRPADVAVLAGDDTSALAVLAMGGSGVVSSAANEIPADVVALCAAGLAGDWRGARRLHERWLPVFLSSADPAGSPVSRAGAA